MEDKKKDALDYHAAAPAGKISVEPTKSMVTQVDLSLAYSPGVAEPCLEIHSYRENVYKYTAKGNLVAVISNGTAVLGLGNIGAEASKPVMEGKGVLFKKFAGIDVFDIEVNEEDPQKFINTIKAIAPTFGGINLEDIKAPESFLIEETLRKELDIPVMHDDQHGTAIISAAALLNALEIVSKKIENIQLVVSGAGAAAIACVNLYLSLGMKRENIIMVDSKGVIRQDRSNLSSLKAPYATSRGVHTLAEAIEGADMFLGLSRGGVLSTEMLLKMASKPIVFALANPDPEIPYELACSTRRDIIMATGRSDHPNQVNNVLGFPYIFRGALDVRARTINEEMKHAAVQALASLAKEPVPDSVIKVYGAKKISFGKEYLIPKPFDPRLITIISPAVAQAAMKSGVSRIDIYDWQGYKKELEQRVGIDAGFVSEVVTRATKEPKRIAFGNAEDLRVLRAARRVWEEGIGTPILLGNKRNILELLHTHQVMDEGYEIIDPAHENDKRETFAKILFEKRKRKGIIMHRAKHLVNDVNYFGMLLLETGEVDAFISGLLDDYTQVLRSAIEVIGLEEGILRTAGMYVLSNQHGTYFFSDVSVNINPDAELLARIVSLSARFVTRFNRTPKIALLSYSNFGSSKGELPLKIQKTLKILEQSHPDLIVDGDMQAGTALSADILREQYPFSKLQGNAANTLIFPNLSSGNIAYKLLVEIGGFEGVGPILMGMRKPVHILQQGSSVREIFNLAAFAAIDAQTNQVNTNKKI